jgi:hypothetical protein
MERRVEEKGREEGRVVGVVVVCGVNWEILSWGGEFVSYLGDSMGWLSWLV